MKQDLIKDSEMKNGHITFHDLKMEIQIPKGSIARYYGDLMYMEYDAPYCMLHFSDNHIYNVEISMQYMQDNLPEAAFFRCNRSVIINICYYREYQTNHPKIVMDDGATFNLSRRKSKDFLNLKKSLPRISPPCSKCYDCKDESCESRAVFCRHKKCAPT